MLLAGVVLAECGAVPEGRAISPASPEVERVRAALGRWPPSTGGVPQRRPFAVEMRLGKLRAKGTGTMEYFGPRDFRVTALGEDGRVIFDGRLNWGGPIVLGGPAELDKGAFEGLLVDLSRGFEMPSRLEGLRAGTSQMALTGAPGGAQEFTWIFDRAEGRLVETEVNMGTLDVLRVYYGDYSGAGPARLRLLRLARQYDVAFVFTDGDGKAGPRAAGSSRP
jgi:hypothetical protein